MTLCAVHNLPTFSPPQLSTHTFLARLILYGLFFERLSNFHYYNKIWKSFSQHVLAIVEICSPLHLSPIFPYVSAEAVERPLNETYVNIVCSAATTVFFYVITSIARPVRT